MSGWFNAALALLGIGCFGAFIYGTWLQRRYAGQQQAPAEIPETGAFNPQPGEHENVRIARARAKFMLQLLDEFRLRGAATQDAFEMARSWMRAGEEADLLKPQGLKGRE